MIFLLCHLTQPSTTPDTNSKQRFFHVIHPFHPLFEREFELFDYRKCWGEDRVFYLDEAGVLRSLPARWTSAVADDPLVVIAAGRSLFRVPDLLELVDLVRGAKR